MNSTKLPIHAPTPSIIGSIYSIPAAEIHPMPDSPYAIQDDNSMQELIDSVKQHGVLTPVVVRPKEDDGYEMIAGARRKYACELAGIKKLPAIVLNLDDDDAIIRRADTNMPIYLGVTTQHMAERAAHLSQTSLPIGGRQRYLACCDRVK